MSANEDNPDFCDGKLAQSLGEARTGCPYRRADRRKAWLAGWDASKQYCDRQTMTPEQKDRANEAIRQLKEWASKNL